MRVGLFGGSFNPPHAGHLIIAEAIRDQFALDRVMWMPGFRVPHKDARGMASAEDRLKMVRLATEGNPAFLVSDLEIRRGGVSYTVDTIRHLQDEAPGDEFSLAIGGDSYRQLPSWREPEEIARRVDLIVYGRGKDGPPEALPFPVRAQFAAAPLLGISSTDIRARRASKRSVRYLVPEPVRLFIEAQGLYLQG